MCDTRSNDFFGWSEWSKCSEICDYGQQYQTKLCTSQEVKINKCMNKDDMINTRTRQCFLKQCKYNQKFKFNYKNISILIILAFLFGILSVLVRIFFNNFSIRRK